MNVTIEQAFTEACCALGEAVINQRLLSAEIQRLTPSDSEPPPEPPAATTPQTL